MARKSKKNWSPRQLDDWVQESLRSATEELRSSARFDGHDDNWDAHLGDTPWSEMDYDGVVWASGNIQALLNLADEFDLRIRPGVVQRAEMYQVGP